MRFWVSTEGSIYAFLGECTHIWFLVVAATALPDLVTVERIGANTSTSTAISEIDLTSLAAQRSHCPKTD